MKRKPTLRTLRARLIIVMLTAILPLFGLALVSVVFNTDEAVSQAKVQLALSASVVAASQQKSADATRQTLTVIAHTPGLLDAELPVCERYFNTLHNQLLGHAKLGLIGLDGQIRCDSRPNDLPVDLSANPSVNAPVPGADRPYFLDAMKANAFINSGYLEGRVSGQPVMVFASPVMDSSGKTGAFAFASVPLSALVETSGLPILQTGRVVIADRSGVVLATSPKDPTAPGKPLPSPWMLAALKQGLEGVREGTNDQGVKQIYAFQRSSTSPDAPFFVVVSADWSEVVAPVYQRLVLVLMALVLVALLGVWLAWRMGTRTILRPAARILEATRQLEQGQLDVRIALDTLSPEGEFSLIASNFNRMAEALQHRIDELKIELNHSQRAQAALQDAQQVQSKSYVELRQAQCKLLQAQRLCRIGHWQLDLSTHKVSWSDELYELYGLTPGDFDGDNNTFMRMMHPDDVGEYMRRRESALKDQVELDIEFRIITPQGATRWMYQVGQTHFSNDGVPLYRAGAVQEITARKQSDLALRKITEQLELTGEMANVGGWELSLADMQLSWSQQTFRIHDLDPAGGMDLSRAIAFYAPEARAVISAAVQLAAEQGTPWTLELPMITATGRNIWVRSQGRAVQHAGKVIRLTGAFQDITEQRQALSQLRLLETCVARLNDMVLITEADPVDAPGPRIVFVNDAFGRRTGYSREEVLGKTPRLLQGPKTQRPELDRISAALKNFQSVRAELINYTKSGEEFWVELDIVPIADGSGWYTHWVAIERDITQRKQAEKALMDSEHRYIALFETAPVPMWVIDHKTGQFLMVNTAAVKAYGYTKDEMLSMTLFDIRPESEHQRLRQDLADALPESERKTSWIHRRKDGSVFPVSIFARVIKYSGDVLRFVVALDVTPQVNAEKEIQEHLFTLQRAADAAQAITWHQTLEGTLQEVAEQARGVIGAHQAVVSLAAGGSGLPAITVVSLSSKYACDHDQINTSDGAGIYTLVSEGSRPVRMTQAELEAHPRWRSQGVRDNPYLPLRGWLAIPLMNRDGKNMGVLELSDKYEGEFTLQDEYVALELTQLASIALQNAHLIEEVSQLNAGLERKVAERTVALARQEALFRGLAEQAPQVVWTSDAQGALTYVNQAWFGLVGGDMQSWAGSQWFCAIHPEDLPDVRANWKLSRAHGSAFVGIRRLRAKSGAYHTMSYRAAPVLGTQAEVLFWVGIDADITEVKNIEAALRLSNQELEAFSYSVSHDLRSPLNTIGGFSQLLSKQLATDESVHVKGRHYLSRIQAGVAQMGKLIEDLLSMSQVSRMQLNYQSIDLSGMSQHIMDEWQRRQPERQASIDIQGNLRTHGDVRLIGVLMENLLGNAWKFTSKKPQAHISVGQYLDAAGLPVFFVRDNGAGFDMAYADKLFMAFQRLHTESEFPGTGIGLATVSRVVSRHGGLLWAEAVPEQGATFFFTLPDRLTT